MWLEILEPGHNVSACFGARSKVRPAKRPPLRCGGVVGQKPRGRSQASAEDWIDGGNNTMSNKHALPVKGFEPYKEKAGDEYMSKAQLEHFSQLLLAWK